MKSKKCIIYLLVALVQIALLGGCFGTSPPSRFYTLSPREFHGISSSDEVGVIVRVGPITIPSYLDRRQIVTRSGRNEILLAEYDRWGGSLDDEVTRFLVIDLTERLSPKRIAVAPWMSVPMADILTPYRIPINIDRFDGTPGESVVLIATWGVIKKKDRADTTLIARESAITERVGAKDYPALVAAMGKALQRLGKEIAESIETLSEMK